MKRRKFIQLIAGSTAASTAACSLDSEVVNASTRPRTVAQQEGPFYPVEPIEDTSNLLLAGHRGSELLLSGTVFDDTGNRLNNARIEIWQCDAAGIYKHPAEPATASFDAKFKGSGATTTDANGRYQFKTIVPVPYTGRPPHIHTKVFLGGNEQLTSQIYLTGSGGHEELKIALKAADDQAYAATFDFVIGA